jgi:phospholipid/cholesterol/gamma-HCH transport system substrate-binding protein
VKIAGQLSKLIIFAAVTLLLTGVLAQTIGNITFTKTNQYKAVFTDVAGLLAATDVRIAGVKVGQVKKIEIHQQKQAEVTFTVNRNIRIPRSSRVEIKFLNLVGGRFLTLEEGPGTAMLPADGTIPVAQTKPALDLDVLLNGFKPLFQALNPPDVNRLAFEIIETLQGEGGTINDLLIHTASLTNTIADKDQLIGSVISNLNTVLATVDERDNQLDQLIVQLQRLFSGLSQDRQAIGDSLSGIDVLTGDLAGLLKDIRPALKPDIEHLGSVAAQLNSQKGDLTKQLKDFPQRVNTATRTATYGSWFNFFLCKADGNVTFTPLPTTAVPNPLPQTLSTPINLNNPDPVCVN